MKERAGYVRQRWVDKMEGHDIKNEYLVIFNINSQFLTTRVGREREERRIIAIVWWTPVLVAIRFAGWEKTV